MKRFRFLSAILSVSASMFLGACDPNPGEVKVIVTGTGHVRSNPEGISCDAGDTDCTATLGRAFVLYAEPGDGQVLVRWDGDPLCVAAGGGAVVIGRAPDHRVDCTAVFDVAPAPQMAGQQ